MPETPHISDKILTVFILIGLLLGLLVNAVVTVRFNEYSANVVNLIKLTFLFSTGFLFMSILKGLFAYVTISNQKPVFDPEFFLDSTYHWLLASLCYITATIALIRGTASKS
jgi:hypothetical protein